MKIFQSATKLVLILFALAIVIGLFTSHITEDTFKVAAMMVLTYYFTKAQTVKEANQEAGKDEVISVLESLKE